MFLSTVVSWGITLHDEKNIHSNLCARALSDLVFVSTDDSARPSVARFWSWFPADRIDQDGDEAPKWDSDGSGPPW